MLQIATYFNGENKKLTKGDNMRKIIFILIILLVAGVSVAEVSAISDAEKTANDILNKNSTDSKVLVVYFSRTGENYNVGNIEVGNTAMVASYIKEYMNADSFEIVPVEKYSDNYDECLNQATKEKDEGARPAIQNKIDNFDQYDTVFIGYPIWWGELPMIMHTFMESYDFNGKTVIPFNTHAGSGDAGTYTAIKDKLPNANVTTNGLALDGSTARSEEGKEKTIEWLKGLGY